MNYQFRIMVLAANAVLVGLSTGCFRSELLHRSSFWSVIAISSLLCRADVSREEKTSVADQLPASRRIQLLCHVMGVAVFLVWWTAIMFAGTDASLRLLGGIAIAVIGASIRRRAVLSLGEHFVSDVHPTRNGEVLKTNGIYTRVRHPSELGLLLVCIGGGLATGSIVSLAVSLGLLIPLSFIRVRLEECSLRGEFGQAYVEYQKKTGRFLPKFCEAVVVLPGGAES